LRQVPSVLEVLLGPSSARRGFSGTGRGGLRGLLWQSRFGDGAENGLAVRGGSGRDGLDVALGQLGDAKLRLQSNRLRLKVGRGSRW
jgi:hypothetical protein